MDIRNKLVVAGENDVWEGAMKQVRKIKGIISLYNNKGGQKIQTNSYNINKHHRCNM